MTMKKSRQIHIGIIGMGSMGCGYADMILQGKAPGLKLWAVTRIKEEKREWAKQNLPAEVPVFQSIEELLDCEGLEAVLIATPHYAHPELTIAALQKGLHALCDKPVGVDTLHARKAVEAARIAGTDAKGRKLVFAMMFNQRTHPIYQKLRSLVQEGTYGGLKRVNWIITDWYRTEGYYHSSPWRATWAGEGGGVLINQCPHNLDLLQWICGMPCRVQAFCHEGKWHDIEVEDDVTAYMEFPNGATGVFVTSTGDAPGTNRLEIDLEQAQLICENGELRIFELEENEADCRKASDGRSRKPTGHWMQIVWTTETATAQAKPAAQVSSTVQVMPATLEISGRNLKHPGILQNFADAILDGTPLIARGEEGLNSLMLSNAMHLSSWQKRMVEIPFDEEEYYRELQKKIAKSGEK